MIVKDSNADERFDFGGHDCSYRSSFPKQRLKHSDRKCSTTFQSERNSVRQIVTTGLALSRFLFFISLTNRRIRTAFSSSIQPKSDDEILKQRRAAWREFTDALISKHTNMLSFSRTLLSAITILTALASTWSPAVHADMTITPMILSVAGEKNAPGTVRVTSQSADTQYVKVAIKRLVNPATDDEKEEDVTNWDGSGVAVSPMKFVLPAGSSRAVRIISMAAPAQDEAYRAYFEGVSSPDEEEGKDNQTMSAQIKINVVWGVLVRASAKNAKPRIERQGNLIRNVGNTRIGLVSAGTCSKPNNDDTCDWHAIERSIYPGSSYTLPEKLGAAPIRVKFKSDAKPGEQIQELAGNS